MDAFFSDVFAHYPITDPQWKVYRQHAFKVAIYVKNKTQAPRDLLEVRSGRDGSIELVDGKPHVLLPGEERWIAIEPSNKSFKYAGTRAWGSAVYPKKLDEARTQWRPLRIREVTATYQAVRRGGLVVPFEQIAATLASLYPDMPRVSPRALAQALEAGAVDLGVPGVIRLFQSRAKVVGRLVRDRAFPLKRPVFPMGYREVPIERGVLLVIDLDDRYRLKRGTVKYNLGGQKVQAPVVARIIDAPAVKGAVWLPDASKARFVVPALRKAQRILCDATSYTRVSPP